MVASVLGLLKVPGYTNIARAAVTSVCPWKCLPLSFLPANMCIVTRTAIQFASLIKIAAHPSSYYIPARGHSPRWLLCAQRASCSPPHTTRTDVTLGCSSTRWNACLDALKDSQCLMKVPGDLLALRGPCVRLEAETQAGCQWFYHDHSTWSAEEIQQESRGTRLQTLENTYNLVRCSPEHCNAGWVEEFDQYLALFFPPKL